MLSPLGLSSLTDCCLLERFGEVRLNSVTQEAFIGVDETGQ